MDLNKLDSLLQQKKTKLSEANIGGLLSLKRQDLEKDLLASIDKICKKRKVRKNTAAKRKFSSHPKRMVSDSDISGPTSPKFPNSICSSDSHLNLIYKNQSFKAGHSKQSSVDGVAKKTHDSSSDTDSLINNKTRCFHRNAFGDDVDVKAAKSAKPLLRGTKYDDVPSARVMSRRSANFECRIKAEPAVKRNKSCMKSETKVQSTGRGKITRTVENPELKLRTLLPKIICLLADISQFISNGDNEPDGDEDLERRKKRAVEFSTRFSRNYLYEIGRYLGDLEILSNCGRIAKHGSDFDAKLIACHQIILQAFVAYKRHMPTSFIELTFEKLHSLLSSSLQLCTLHKNSGMNAGQGDFDAVTAVFKISEDRENAIQEFETQLHSLMEKINMHRISSTASLLKSRSTRISLSTKKSKANIERRKTALNGKLSMYMIPSASNKWKKQMGYLPKKKFNVSSRYKEATFKHRPPPIVEPIPKHKFMEKRSSCVMKDTPPFSPIEEDDIETLVESESKRKDELVEAKTEAKTMTTEVKTMTTSTTTVTEVPANIARVEEMKKLEPLVALMSSFLKKNGQNTEEVASGQEQLQSIIAQLADLVREKTEQTEEKAVTTDDGPEMTGKDVPPLDLKERPSSHKLKKKPSVTVTGAKNAKLICIVDDNSIISEASTEKPPPDDSGDARSCEQLIYKEREVLQQFETLDPKPAIPKFNEVKLCRLPKKPRRALKLLAKDYILNVVQYKFQFHKHTKASHMYKKSTTIQPWLLTGKISDKLLDWLLLDVAREIEVNDVLEQLYQSEFQ